MIQNWTLQCWKCFNWVCFLGYLDTVYVCRPMCLSKLSNSLPPSVCTVDSNSSFRRALKTHLFQLAFIFFLFYHFWLCDAQSAGFYLVWLGTKTFYHIISYHIISYHIISPCTIWSLLVKLYKHTCRTIESRLLRSLKVIGIATDRSDTYDFLLLIHAKKWGLSRTVSETKGVFDQWTQTFPNTE